MCIGTTVLDIIMKLDILTDQRALYLLFVRIVSSGVHWVGLGVKYKGLPTMSSGPLSPLAIACTHFLTAPAQRRTVSYSSNRHPNRVKRKELL